jgi:DNA-binding winged helix-turn-helix (wHTH) protein
VVSKPQILDRVWHYDFGGDGGVVETYIGYLRRKLDNVEPRLIHTIRGVGYTLRDQSTSASTSASASSSGSGSTSASTSSTSTST